MIGSYGLGVQKNIRRGCREFSRFVRFEVRDESKIRFWQDVWCGDQTSKASFLVFNIVRYKEASVADHMLFSNNTFQRNITFIKSVHHWFRLFQPRVSGVLFTHFSY
jgi:hypothetical protein